MSKRYSFPLSESIPVIVVGDYVPQKGDYTNVFLITTHLWLHFSKLNLFVILRTDELVPNRVEKTKKRKKRNTTFKRFLSLVT